MSGDRIREISQVANQFLCDNIGDAVTSGTPAQESLTSDWRVEIFCDTDYGWLRCGELQIDQAGSIVSAPSRNEVSETVRRMKEKLSAA